MNTEGIKHAALCLHSLGREDRQWLLAQLDDGQRQVIETCLAELRTLGIPAEPSLIREAAGQPAADHAESSRLTSAQAEPDRFSRVDRLPASALFSVLAAEPDATVAALVWLHPWSWRPALLDILGPDRRARIEAARGNRPLPRAFGEAMLTVLLEQAGNKAGELPGVSLARLDPAEGLATVTARLWHRVRTWLD